MKTGMGNYDRPERVRAGVEGREAGWGGPEKKVSMAAEIYPRLTRRTRPLPAPVNSCNCTRSSSSSPTMYRMFITASITVMETVDHGTLSVSIRANSPLPYTEQQGQYLAFIHVYTKVNGRPPAQADMQRFFAVTAPSVHQMVLTLERRGLLRRTPGRPRSLKVLVAPEDLPILR